jgi:molecular chaperone DnaK
MGQDVLQQIKSLFISLNLIEILIAIILHWHEDFNSIRWQNPARARQLLNQAISVIQDNPTSDKLLPIAKQIIDLLPEDERANVGGLLKVG